MAAPRWCRVPSAAPRGGGAPMVIRHRAMSTPIPAAHNACQPGGATPMTQPARPSLREEPFGYTVTLVPGAKEVVAGIRTAFWDPQGAVSERTKELVFLRPSVVTRCET